MVARNEHVDVVMIGAGWTASILAWKLASAGLRVRSVEQGEERWTATHFQHNHDGLRYIVRKALLVDLSIETWTWRPNDNVPALPLRMHGSFHPGQGTGGAGVHWSGQLFRYYPHHFRYRSHLVERYGENMLPEGSTLQDWPITWDEIEPHYAQFEIDAGVSGRAGNINGVALPGGNPFEGPRSTPYPLPPFESSVPAMMFRDAVDSLGYHPFPVPAGLLSEAYTGLSGTTRAGCLYCGYCTRHGCEVDAKSSPLTDHLPAALATGNYDILYKSRVTNILLDDDGRARGFRYIDLETGEVHEQTADIVILSGYTLTNVRMLLLSRNSAHPEGVGNSHGKVGKQFTYHISRTPATGVFEGRRFNQFMGNYVTSQYIHDFNGDNFDHSDLGFIGGGPLYAGAGESDPLTSVQAMPYLNDEKWADYEESEPDMVVSPLLKTEVADLAGVDVEWGQDWKDNLRQNWDAVVGISTMAEVMPYEANYMDLDPTYTDAWGEPLLRITFEFQENERKLYDYLVEKAGEIMEAMEPDSMSTDDELGDYEIASYQTTHCTGGAIMGDSPENSVTNKYGQVWDTPNLFVTGAALYPMNPGMDHTGTATALAYMTGDAIIDQYLGNEGELMD